MNTIKTIVTMVSLNIMLSSSGCDTRENLEKLDDKLTLEKVDYNGNELRIDGYYRHFYYAGTGKEQKLQGVTPFFLYRNGIILGDVGASIDKVSEMEESFRNGSYASNSKKYYWGVFQINGTQIKYEKWIPTHGPFPVVIYEGEILNDTTFVINKAYEAKDAGKKAPLELDWEFHFKQFSPKPDSTNRYIP